MICEIHQRGQTLVPVAQQPFSLSFLGVSHGHKYDCRKNGNWQTALIARDAFIAK